MVPLTLLIHGTPGSADEQLAGELGAAHIEACDEPLGVLLARRRASGGAALILSRSWPGPLLASLLEFHILERNALTLLTTTGEGAGIVRDPMGRITALSHQPRAEVFGGALVCDLAEVPAFTGEVRDLVAALTKGGARVGGIRAEGADRGKACPLCGMDGEPSRESGLLLVGRHVRLAIDCPGFNSGQLICFPQRHITSMVSLNADERGELSAMLRRAEAGLREVYHYDALNLGANSRPGEHVAMRIIPRWAGDLNFLPLVSGLKPVPESPGQAWHKLREVLR